MRESPGVYGGAWSLRFASGGRSEGCRCISSSGDSTVRSITSGMLDREMVPSLLERVGGEILWELVLLGLPLL